MGDCTFLSICPFFQGVQFIGVELLVVVSYDPLYFCGICYNFFFISNFFDLSAFPFFS